MLVRGTAGEQEAAADSGGAASVPVAEARGPLRRRGAGPALRGPVEPEPRPGEIVHGLGPGKT